MYLVPNLVAEFTYSGDSFDGVGAGLQFSQVTSMAVIRTLQAQDVLLALHNLELVVIPILSISTQPV